MDFTTFITILFVGYLLFQLIRLYFADADLATLWAEKHGKRPCCLVGQVVWITGASSGIGENLAYQLARAGCRLILSARREKLLQEVKQKCITQGNLNEKDVLVLPLDVLDKGSHLAKAELAWKHFGHINVLVNNAGRSSRGLFENTPLKVDEQMFDLNVMGVLSITKALLPYMIERRAGHIMVTSSVSGKLGAPVLANYSGSKHALQGIFDALRTELMDRNINITLVCPGPIRTDSLLHGFSEKVDESLGIPDDQTEKRLSAERCAELMAVALANRLDEIWVSLNPVLLFTYVSVYMPSLALWIRKNTSFAKKRILNYHAGKTSMYT